MKISTVLALNFLLPYNPSTGRSTPGKNSNTQTAPKEFKAEILQRFSEGQSTGVVARSLNISRKLLYSYKNQQKNLADVLQQLKAKIKRVEMEPDVLKNMYHLNQWQLGLLDNRMDYGHD